MKTSNESPQMLNEEILAKRYQSLTEIMNHVLSLYTFNESSVVLLHTGQSLLESVTFVLGFDLLEDDKARILETDEPLAVFREKKRALDERVDEVLDLWERVCVVMPQINNIALRDTLASIGEIKWRYDTLFAAHEIPCDIDYPLSKPISEDLKGLDYIQAWLEQVYNEALFLARFEVQDCIEILEAWCPDYRGLLINLYDPIYEAWNEGKISYKK